MDMQRIDAAGAEPKLCDLFGVHSGSQDHLGTKARNATEEEVRAYFDWLRRRAGLPDLGTMTLEGMNYGLGGRDNPRCCGVATSTLPVEPKKGGVVWSREAVRAAHGPIAKPARKRKAGPIVEIAAPEPVERGPSEPPADPLAEAQARLGALEAQIAALSAVGTATPTGGKRRRTPAHERAIRRAWAARRDRIERADLDRRALLKVNADNRLLLEQLQHAEAVRDEMVRRGDAMHDERDRLQALVRISGTKRRKNALLARQRTREMVAAVNQLLGERDALRAELDTARRTPTYFDADSGIEKFDLVGQQAHFAKLARDRAERAEHALAAISARCERTEASRDALADSLDKLVSRLARAEAEMRRLGQAA